MTRDAVTVHELTERENKKNKIIIDELMKLTGETFSKDPYVSGMFTEPVATKMELAVKAHALGNDDPNFFLMYLRDDAKASSNVSPYKCCAVLNVGRDQTGMPISPRLYFLLFLYCLPYLFTWGLSGVYNCLKSAYKELYRSYVYGEMADRLGVKMTDCYQLEYLATRLTEVGKGYGAVLMEALHRKADANKKHIILYSSSKRNVSFYKRFGYEILRDYGDNCTLMFRRHNGKE